MSNQQLKLSEGAFQIIMNGGDVTNPTVQVLGIKKVKSFNVIKERYRLLLSDGKFTITLAMLSTDCMEDPNLDNFAVIKLTKYITNLIRNPPGIARRHTDETRLLLILEFELVAMGRSVENRIGNPVLLICDESGRYRPHFDITRKSFSTAESQIFGETQDRSQPRAISTQNIGLDISPIASLNPFHNRWFIKARVVTKTELTHWSNSRGTGMLLSFTLMDASGEIRCTAFCELAEEYFSKIEIDRVYVFSKGLLKPANRQYNNGKHEFEMTIVTQTVVEECPADDPSVPQTNFEFVDIKDIEKVPAESCIDILGVCVEASSLQTIHSKSSNRELIKRDIVLIDQSKAGVILTLWGARAEKFESAAQKPILALKGVKVVEFMGKKSVTPKMGCDIRINPDMTESRDLKTWFDSEGHRIKPENISLKVSENSSAPLKAFSEAEEQQITNPNHVDYYQVIATVLVIKGENSVYKACPTEKCGKKLVNLENGMYKCIKCNCEYSNYKYRMIANALLADATGNIWVSMFANEAERLLGKTSLEMGELLDSDFDAAMKVFDDVQYKTFNFKCRQRLETYNDVQRMKTTVIRVDSVDYGEYNSYLVDKIQNSVISLC